MKIALINGSPKRKESASGVILEDLMSCLKEEHEVMNFALETPVSAEGMKHQLTYFDVLVFAFPLYVDGLPSHLVQCLCELEDSKLHNKVIHVYGISNCGFYEGEQNEISLDILKAWCMKTGLHWMQGLGMGAGGALTGMRGIPLGKSIKKSYGNALNKLANNIEIGASGEPIFVTLDFPRAIYKLAAHKGWKKSIKANGGKVRDLKKRK